MLKRLNKINNKKEINIGLREIYGIGKRISKKVCDIGGIPRKLKVEKLKKEDKRKIIDVFYYMSLEENLKSKIRDNIIKFMILKIRKGYRHIKGYPVHGQRTKTNNKTQKKLRRMRYEKRI